MNDLIKEEQKKLKTECTFKPQVNKNYLLMNASSFDPDQNFLDRQKDF